MLEFVIYDGNHRDSVTMKTLVGRYQQNRPDLSLHVSVCTCAEELFAFLGPRIYLLDVTLPDTDGIEAARRLRAQEPGAIVIFITASRRLALEAYRVRALQYLLKPAVECEVFAALDEAISLMGRQKEQRFQVKTPTGYRWLLLSEILYLRPNQHVVELVLQDGTQISTQNLRQSFSHFAAPLLESGRFVRPHHSYVVNASYIDHLTPDALILRDETAIPVSHSKYQDMKALFQN